MSRDAARRDPRPMTFRAGFWMTTIAYLTVLVVQDGSVPELRTGALEATMGSFLGLGLASVFGHQARLRDKQKRLRSGKRTQF